MSSFACGAASLMQKTAIGLFAVGALTASSADAALIPNGGFEAGDLSGWTQSGDTDYTGASDSGIAHTGSWYGYMGPVGMGYLSQSIPTAVGTQYQLSYWLACDAGTGVDNLFQVSINGSAQGALTVLNPAEFAWTEYNTTFTATSTSTGIEFGARHDVKYWYIDDVSVTAVPEPTSLALIGVTAGLLTARRRKL